MGTDSFREFALEQLPGLDDLRCKRIFGGAFFGILFEGPLYFKTHPRTLQDYLASHTAVFAPLEKQVLQNYREVPVDILEDTQQLTTWARKTTQP